MTDEYSRKTELGNRLTESGKRAELKQFVVDSLTDCGWRDDLKAQCIEYIKSRALDRITVDDLVAEIAPRGRAMVPAELKAELLERIRAFAEKEKL
jgi:enhancer of yellow 2 transcription factor